MNTKLFRKSSIDRVNSPEQLNEYIRVANPGVWLVLAAVVVLLIGIVIWGVFGNVETKVETGVSVDQKTALCYVSEEYASRITPGMAVRTEEFEGTVKGVSSAPVKIEDNIDDYILYLTGFSSGDFCYEVEVSLPGAAAGIYPAEIIIDSTKPMYFVIH